MFNVIVKNKDGAVGWSASFLLQEDASAWIQKQLEYKSWGEEPDIEIVHIEPRVISEQELKEIRTKDMRDKRDALLAACDWTQLVDAPLNLEQKKAWREYRQALRDLPQNSPNILEVDPEWPEKPE